MENLAAERLERECMQESQRFNQVKLSARDILQPMFLQQYGLDFDVESDYADGNETEEFEERECEEENQQLENEEGSEESRELASS